MWLATEYVWCGHSWMQTYSGDMTRGVGSNYMGLMVAVFRGCW